MCLNVRVSTLTIGNVFILLTCLLLSNNFTFTALYEKEILKWKDDDNIFLEIHSFQKMIEKVKQQPYVTFVGVPGSGKTATARHIALILEEEGYEILPIKKIEFIETFCDPDNPQVFLLDDVVGVYGFDMKEFDTISRYEDSFINPTMHRTKIIMTCREAVFKNEALSNTFMSEEKNVIMLHSAENALTDQDKYDLFSKYNINPSFLDSLCTSTTFSFSSCLSKTSKMFPLICKLFSNEENFRQYGPNFFVSPVPCLLKLLDSMEKRNKVHYASLVLLMINQNKLTETDFEKKQNEENFIEMKCQVLKMCKVNPSTACFELIDALTAMEGTYTEQCQNEFKFVHDSMFEIVAWHFGRRCPELILHYMDSKYIANNIKMEIYNTMKSEGETGNTCKEVVNVIEYTKTDADDGIVNNLCITLRECHCHLLADRLFKDIKNGELFNVFENEVLKHPLVLENFINVMKNKSYPDLHSVFLTESVDLVKNKDHDKYFPRMSFNLLINSRWFDCSYYMLSRAIRWVIFYGHNQILQFIIDQIMINTKQIIHLFQTSRGKDHKGLDSTCNTMEDGACDSMKGGNCDLLEKTNFKKNRKWNSCSMNQYTTEDKLLNRSDIVEHRRLLLDGRLNEQRRLLLLGCLSGDLPTVQTLLKYIDKSVLDNVKLNYPVKVYYSYSYLRVPPLMVASKNGHLDIVLELLKHNANVNDIFDGITSLINMCSEGRLDIVFELLKHGANANFKVYDNSPLIAACSRGHLGVVQELIKHDADVNIKVSNNSPLIAACLTEHLGIVRELLKHDADVNMTVSNNSPLNAACFTGHLGIVRELLKHKANVNITVSDMSPLMSASSRGHLDIKRELLKHGAKVNMSVSEGLPHCVACSNEEIVLIQELRKHKFNITYFTDEPFVISNEDGYSRVYIQLSENCENVIVEIKHSNNQPHIRPFSTAYLVIDLSTNVVNYKYTIDSQFGFCRRFCPKKIVSDVLKFLIDIATKEFHL